MTDNNDLHSLLSQLYELKRSKNHLTTSTKLNDRFHSKTNDILAKWTSKELLSEEEKTFLDFYSTLQLSFVEYSFFNSDTTQDVPEIISKLPRSLFKTDYINGLTEAVDFIRQDVNEDDIVLVYVMRMIDARAYAYRLCSGELTDSFPRALNQALMDCFNNSLTKHYLYDIKSMDERSRNIVISNRQRFFIGCGTYAIALFPANKAFLIKDEHTKYIYLLAKSVRVMLGKTNFEQDNSILYCLRGILAILTNCVRTEHWMHIINKALVNNEDDDAQQANPFNTDLFSKLIHRLLGSDILEKKALQTDSHAATSLVDVTLIFLGNWFDLSNDLDNDDDDDNDGTTNEPNQVLHLLRLNPQFNANKSTSQRILPYVDAKYDRLRLMAVSTLSSLMSHKDFEDFNKQNSNSISKEIIPLIFHFIDRAFKQENHHQYKGVPFERLLCYLFRFLIQDNFKKQTLPYISQIIHYAKERHFYALKILRRMSTCPEIQQSLLNNTELEEFLKGDADYLFKNNHHQYQYIEGIRRNLQPVKHTEPQTLQKTTGRQAFISYSRRDKVPCDKFSEVIEQAGIFTKIWLDRNDMCGNLVDVITKNISQSEVVFALISDTYCTSGACRRELEFAYAREKPIYYIFVQEGFEKGTCDWILYYMSTDVYYRPGKAGDLEKLIHVVTQKIRNDSDKFPPPAPKPSTDNTQPTHIESMTKHIIAGWTPEQIQEWCRENNLHQWCESLTYYDGRALLELHKVLKNDAYLQHISSSEKIALLDVIRFKCQLDKLVSETTTSHASSAKKPLAKRRASKASVK